jgi:hypothetical protein
MAHRHGKNSRVQIGASVIKCTQLDINMTQDTVEVTGFGDSNKTYVLGTKDFQATFSGFWDDATDSLFDTIDAGAAVTAYFYPDVSNAPTQWWAGSVLVQGSLGSSVSGAVTFQGSAAAQSAITRSGIA